MNKTIFSIILSLTTLHGYSYPQKIKRIPASVLDVNEKLPCGLFGEIEERIEDCSTQDSSRKKGFVLVTRSSDFYEVHQDVKTQILWGDKIPGEMNWLAALNACEKHKLSMIPAFGRKRTWKLPSLDELEEAYRNGMREALPNMNFLFIAMDAENFYAPRYAFNGNTGEITMVHYFDGLSSVRCVSLY